MRHVGQERALGLVGLGRLVACIGQIVSQLAKALIDRVELTTLFLLACSLLPLQPSFQDIDLTHGRSSFVSTKHTQVPCPPERSSR
jgi:hypothetical protein